MLNATSALQDIRFSFNYNTLLLDLLQQEAGRQGHTFQELGEHLGYAYPLLQQLKSGCRPKHIDQLFVTHCAEYLNAPVLTVLLALGEISEHTLSYSLSHLETHVKEALEMLKKDKAFSCYARLDFATIDPLARNLIVSLYAKSFLPKREAPRPSAS